MPKPAFVYMGIKESRRGLCMSVLVTNGHKGPPFNHAGKPPAYVSSGSSLLYNLTSTEINSKFGHLGVQ